MPPPSAGRCRSSWSTCRGTPTATSRPAQTLPEGALDDFRDHYAAIFIGAYGDPRVPDMKHAADILLGIRFGLDLYVNFRPVKLYDARLCPLKDKNEADVDFVVFRENTEGAYVGVGGIFKKGTPDEVAVQEEINTRKGVERILRAAFDYARDHGRREVCMVDKSNVHAPRPRPVAARLRRGGGGVPGIERRHLYVDAAAMQMVRKPETFDVVVANNMFGDILTDLGAALQGGLGLAASANLHPGRTSMFEPVHGSAPKYAGTGRANPMGALVTAALMLDELGHAEAAAAIEDAVRELVHHGEHDAGPRRLPEHRPRWATRWPPRSPLPSFAEPLSRPSGDDATEVGLRPRLTSSRCA